MEIAHKKINALRYENGGFLEVQSHVISEFPVTLTVNGEAWLTFMCTPTHLSSLAVGFLYNENLIRSISDVADVRVCPTLDNIDIWTYERLIKPAHWRQTSGCTGGISSVESTADKPRKIYPPNGVSVSADRIKFLISELFNAQDLYKQSGGVHTSLLTDGMDTTLIAEDIGRHNTLDKLAGRLLLENIVMDHRFLITTGRISSDMIQKAIRLRASIVISCTSPSSLSIQIAEENAITLIGYARRTGFTIYSHHERVYPIHNQYLSMIQSSNQQKSDGKEYESE